MSRMSGDPPGPGHVATNPFDALPEEMRNQILAHAGRQATHNFAQTDRANNASAMTVLNDHREIDQLERDIPGLRTAIAGLRRGHVRTAPGARSTPPAADGPRAQRLAALEASLAAKEHRLGVLKARVLRQ